MYFVYVLENTATRKHYTGFTTDLTQRVGQHNSGVTKSTKNRGKWVLLLFGGIHNAFGSDASGTLLEEWARARRAAADSSGQGRANCIWIESACGGNQEVRCSNHRGR